ncbi:MAG: hypothetical protein AAFX94_03110 [Myxococcota bacterium]
MMRRFGWVLGLSLITAACSSDDDPVESGPGAGTAQSPLCGDGVLDAGEVCEGFELRGANCVSEGFDSGVLSCSAQCTLDTSGCGRCGDGVIDAGEVCEPGMLQGETCATQLGAGFVGDVTCDPTCTGFSSTACRLDFAAGALEACNPRGSTPCSDENQDCVAFGEQSFCAETCVLDTKICGTGRFCYDLDGQGICLDDPDLGEVCSAETGCAGDAVCTPTFDGQGQVSTCANLCSFQNLGQQADNCEASELCLATPADAFALITDATCERDFDCDPFSGFVCANIEGRSVCARPHIVCAERIPFYTFRDSAPADELFCERDAPGGAARFCGIDGPLSDSTLIRARVDCVSLLNESDPVGVCVGFCDAEIIGGASDGFCGEGASCVVPRENARFYIAANEAEPIECDGPLSCSRLNYPECVDVGRGPECVRAARVCQENER